MDSQRPHLLRRDRPVVRVRAALPERGYSWLFARGNDGDGGAERFAEQPDRPAGMPRSLTSQSHAPRMSRYSSVPFAYRPSSTWESPWSRRSTSRTENPFLCSIPAGSSNTGSRRQTALPVDEDDRRRRRRSRWNPPCVKLVGARVTAREGHIREGRHQVWRGIEVDGELGRDAGCPNGRGRGPRTDPRSGRRHGGPGCRRTHRRRRGRPPRGRGLLRPPRSHDHAAVWRVDSP